jgi:hypothetical protein
MDAAMAKAFGVDAGADKVVVAEGTLPPARHLPAL